MPNPELIRIVDGIARDKNIEREQVYVDIEQAVASGLRKQFNTEDTSEFAVTVDRVSGDISVSRQGNIMPLSVMGRIGAQTVKQVMIQLIRQDERGSIYEEYKDRVGTIVTGTIARFEGGTMIVPGHGRLCDEQDVIEYRDMVTIIRDRVQYMIGKGRTLDQKKALYKAIVKNMGDSVGMRPQDVFINLVENAKENWSFGNGEAQYA